MAHASIWQVATHNAIVEVSAGGRGWVTRASASDLVDVVVELDGGVGVGHGVACDRHRSD